MKKIVQFIKRNYLAIALDIVLVIIAVLLSFKSYTPNTFLTGWDTLHPEFNFPHAFSSLMNGVWRSDQGLGAIAAHSHMSELPRVLYLWLSSHVFTTSFLRYSYIFLSLILGPVGMFLFLKRFIATRNITTTLLAAFLGASYYLLNLGTVGRFSVPFEMFVTQFAFLPFLFWSALSFIQEGKKKFIVWFAIFSLLAAPQAYAATLFYAFASLFGLSLCVYSAITKNRKTLRRTIGVLTALFMMNAFWILPNIYSVRNQSSQISSAKINELFTPEALLHNQASGDFLSVVTQKNYLFSWQAYDFSKQTFVPLLSNWNIHLQDAHIMFIPLMFAILGLGGIIVAFMSRHKLGMGLFIPAALTLFFLMNNNGPLRELYAFFQSHSGLFEEGFRDPFTKFSIMFSFYMCFYIALLLSYIFRVISLKKIVRFVPLLITAALFSSLLVLYRPAFKDGLVSPLMRVSIPEEYFEAFHWFNGHEGRIAQLPLNSMWGWQYNNWGYQGAGFFWFGVNSPYLTRDFDRWNSNNETFYKEMSRVMYDNDPASFDSLLEKYNVHYLVLDGSVVDPSNSSSRLEEQTQKFLLGSKAAHEVASFGFIHIYETPFGSSSVTAPSVYSKVNANSTYSSVDYTFAQYGDYVSGSNAVWKPFVNFDTRINELSKTDDWITTTVETQTLSNQVLTIPDIVKREGVLPVILSVQKSPNKIALKFDLIQPQISVNGNTIENKPVYLTTTLSSNNNAGYISVENNVFDISGVNVDNDYHSIGNVYVNSTGRTKVSLFTRNNIVNRSFLSDIVSKKASWCSDPSRELALPRSINGFSLIADENSVCVGSLVSLGNDSLYETSYVSPTGSSSLFCLNKIGTDGCVNVMIPTANPVFGGRKISYVTPLSAGNYWFAFVGQSNPGTRTVSTYNDLILSYHPKISDTQIDFGAAYSLFSSEQNISLDNVHSLSVSYFAPAIISENFYLQRGHGSAVNCDINNSGKVTLQFLGGSVMFTASNNGVSCDYFDYPQLLQSQAYLMSITGENTQGRGIKFYLQNKATNHMDLEELLPNKSFSRSYVLEPYETGEGGFVLNLETRSFDSVGSTNVLSDISFSPIPLKWLTEISVGPHTSVVSNNNLAIQNMSSKGLLTKVQTEGSGILALNQSFEQGWSAFSVPFHKLEHVSVNGWENGWVVDRNSLVYIFYTPQLLEYLGFALLGIATYSLIIRK